ncbi:MAG: hypothetical protein AAGF97_16830, partial [Planctomycetota bacterium]
TLTLEPVTRGFLANFVAGVAFIWGGMFAIGHAIFGNSVSCVLMLALAVCGFLWIWKRAL